MESGGWWLFNFSQECLFFEYYRTKREKKRIRYKQPSEDFQTKGEIVKSFWKCVMLYMPYVLLRFGSRKRTMQEWNQRSHGWVRNTDRQSEREKMAWISDQVYLTKSYCNLFNFVFCTVCVCVCAWVWEKYRSSRFTNFCQLCQSHELRIDR